MVTGSVRDERYQRLIEQLRLHRNAAKITQTGLAQTLGHRQQFVSKYESGERRIDVIEFVDIADALGLNDKEIWDLLRGV